MTGYEDGNEKSDTQSEYVFERQPSYVGCDISAYDTFSKPATNGVPFEVRFQVLRVKKLLVLFVANLSNLPPKRSSYMHL